MAISFVCRGCGKSIRAPDQFAGKRARCPGCKLVVTVPVPAPADDPGYEVVNDVPVPSPVESRHGATETAWKGARGYEPPAREPVYRSPVRPTSSTRRATLPPPDHSLRDRLYWILILALVPLGFSLLGESDDVEQRIAQTREHNEDAFKELERRKEASDDAVFSVLPGGRIEGAHLPHQTWMHWVYAAASAAAFFLLILSLSRAESAAPLALVCIGMFTGTIGILLLLAVQWAAIISQGVWLRGSGIVIVIFYFLKFVGFSYLAALDSENGFLLSFFGFTCGVGFCEEFCKAMPLIMEFRRRSTMNWRGAFLWGLASGVGFGVSEGITYASDHYNGVSTWGVYVVRFVSCVALHGIWSASVGILIHRNRLYVEGDMDFSDWLMPLAKCLGVAMILHGLYDTMLKRDMNWQALVVAVASFAWMAWTVESARSEEIAERRSALATA
jgi:RsiW-degrading membrane proteinase PrsW (M82 family)